MLTGDIHTFFAGDLTTNGESVGTPVGTELVGGSATSLGIPEALGVPSVAAGGAGRPTTRTSSSSTSPSAATRWSTVTKSELTAEYKIFDALTKGAKPTTVGDLHGRVGRAEAQPDLGAEPADLPVPLRRPRDRWQTSCPAPVAQWIERPPPKR